MKKITHLILLLIIGISPLFSQQIILPVEVLGEEGKVVTRTFDLTSQEAGNAVKLWLQVNNLSYENKGSIKINNGSWISLNHQTVTMQQQEKARGGMVHGGFNTIRFSIPATGLVAGSNTIYFRFDLSDAISNGFRVVRFNLLDAGANKILPDSKFKQDDPSTWVAPYTDATSINEGKNLWYYGSLKSNYLPVGRKGFWYSAQINPIQAINAKCSSCHAQDGRDLEIFSYSNESIIERAKFHMLSEEEGKKIASYIRSLSTTKTNVGRWGRPWNPPYQPGPAVANMPIQQWAAGAGLDAVLDEDEDMLPYMFPNGVNQQEVYNHFDSDKSVDRTTLPLAIQFPDWKHWLPMIHPMDAYTKNDYWNSPGKQFDPKKGYTDFRNYLTAQDPSTRNKADLLNKSNDFRTHYRFFLAQGAPAGLGGHWRTPDGAATANLADGVSREMAATSLARLLAVQYFEIFNEFNLQDKASWFTQPGEFPGDIPKSRQWFGNDYHVFEVPAHFQACVNNNCNQFMGQPTETGFYESTNWYHLQLVIGGGEGMMNSNSPVDYNYHPDFMTKASNSSGIYEPLRYYHSMNSMYQTRTWVGGQSPNTGIGFRIRVMGPWNIYGISDGNQFNGFAPGEFAKQLDLVEPGMTSWVLNAMLKQFLKEVNKPYNNLAGWNRLPDGGDNELDRADKTYADIIDAVQRTERQETFFLHYAAKMYYYIPRFQKLGVDCQIMEDWITWCQQAWPLIDWSVFRNKGEMQLSLMLEDDKFCSSTNKIKAVAANALANTVYNWKVNGVTVSSTGNELSTNGLTVGDVVTCQISNNSTCLANKTVLGTLIMPSKGYNLSARKVGEAAYRPLGNINACTNDKVEVKLNIDIQPKQWLDAMDVNAGAEPTNNSNIASWWDKTGHGFNADANKTELQPKYVTNAMNGLPAIVFGADNNADGLELFNTAEDDFMDNDWTIMFVGQSEKPAGNDDWRDIIGNKTEGANGWFWRFGSTARVQMGIGPDLQHGKEYNFNRSFIVQITKKGNVITCYLNGRSDRVITKAANVTMTIADALYIGQSAGGNQYSNRYHKGPISELLVFESAITDAQKEFLEGYLTNKWKLNNELIYTHTYYKNSPFDININAPNGDKYKLDATNTLQTINIDQANKFGNYSIVKEVCSTQVETMSVANGCVAQSPYGGTAWPIPGRIEAENYDLGGEGIAYHDNEAANYGAAFRTLEGVDVGNCPDGGYNIGFIGGGEWTEYTVNATSSKAYILQARVATPNPGKSFHIEVDGVNISGAITVPVTGSWDTYQTVSVTTPTITSGTHLVKIVMDTDGFNLNYVDFIITGAPIISSASSANSVSGRPFKYTILASNNPTSYSATGLPVGLTINSATGVISGTSTATGTYTVIVSATNGVATVSKIVSVTIKSKMDIAPFGDSITQSNEVQTSYRYPLWKKLIDANIPFNYVGSMTTNFNGNPPSQVPYNGIPFDTDNEGHWGIGTNDFANNYIANWSNLYSPDLVLLHLGTNDVATVPTTTSRDNLTRIITRVREVNPYAVIFVAQIIPRGGTVHTAYNDMIATLAASLNTSDSPVILVDQSTGFNTTTDTWDGTHPNAIGDEKMAIRWFEAINGYLNPIVAPVVTSAATATATVGAAFIYAITASNSPTSYSATGLPTGLSVNTATGAISGTPTTAGTYSSTISASNAGGTGTKTLILTVGIPPVNTPYLGTPWPIPGTIQAENYDDGGEAVAYHDNDVINSGGQQRTNQGVDVENTEDNIGGTYNVGWTNTGEWMKYTVNVQATGAYVLEARVASPATGNSFRVEIDGNTIAVVNIPNTTGWQTYQSVRITTPTITAGQHVLRIYEETGGFNLNYIAFTPVVQPPVVSSAATATATVGAAFSYAITASNSPTSYSATGLPVGLSVNTATGAISGTPTTAGTYNTTVSATNSGGTGSKAVTLTIIPAAPVVSSAATATATVGTAFSYAIIASNSPTSYLATGLPAGLSVNTATGAISGIPTTSGTYSTTISATNAGGTGNKALTITINPMPQSAYGGTPWPIPGKIEVENYDNGGEGVAYHDNEATNYGGAFRTGEGVDIGNCPDGTYNLGFIGGGEWTEYTVNVVTTGIYTLEARIATPNPNRSFHVEMDGVNISGSITVPLTNSWDAYQTVSVTTSSLTVGSHILRIYIDAGDFNFNFINFALIAPPSVSSAGTATATVGTAFSYTITASNSPTSYSAIGLPAGISVNTATGVISGTPTTAGTYNTTVSATNAGGTGSKAVTLTIIPAAPVVSSAATATATVGSVFSYAITASNSPTSYSATGLPNGLSVNTATGAISGTPTTAGTYNTTVSATNAGGTGSKAVTLTIIPAAPVVSSAATATATVGSVFSYAITASNSPTSYSATGLPNGLSVNTATGAISGTPTTAGTYSTTVSAANAGGAGSKAVTLTIITAVPVVSSAATATATVGTAFSYAITASNLPTSYSATGLPNGLSVNTATGAISGTPTTAGTYGITISATNSGGTGTKALTLTVGNPPVNTPYLGTPWPIPGTIQAENYDDGGEAVAYHDNDVINSGGQQRTNQGVDVENTGDNIGGTYNVGWTNTGEWMKYTVNVLATGAYVLEARVASPATGNSFRVEIDGYTIAVVNIPNTTGWQTYQSVSITTPTIAAGQHVLRIYDETGGFNLNYIAFTPVVQPPVVSSAATATATVGAAFSYAITASNSPTNYSATGLPVGLSVNTATGAISGTPTTAGTYSTTISASNIGGTGTKALTLNISNPPVNTPYLGTPWPIPGTIQAENYDDGGEGLAYHDNDVVNSGGQQRTNQGVDVENTGDNIGGTYNVGWTNTGEWMKYTVNVLATGAYVLEARVASPAAGNSFRVEIDGYTIASVNIPNTTGWQTYQSVSITTPTITAGQHVLRIYEETGGFNLNYIAFTPVVQPPVVSSAATATATVGAAFSYAITASNSPTSYSVTGLPAGLSVNTATGAISGIPTTAGTYSTTVSVTNSAGTGSKVVTIIINPIPQLPYGGTPWLIPGKIEVENYDIGGEGVAYHDNEATNYGGAFRTGEGVDIGNCPDGTYNLGFIGGGEWTEYTVNVATTGIYTLEARVATPNPNRSFHVEMDGVNISGAITVPLTNSWDTYQTVSVTTSSLTVGSHILRIYIDAGDFNFNFINFALNAATPTRSLSNAVMANATVGSAFTYNIIASNQPTSYSANGLPAGLSVNTSTGLISGIPTASGTFTSTVSAINANNVESAIVSITIANAIVTSSSEVSVVNDATVSIYPNPFCNATTIELVVAQEGKVKIVIYDQVGNEIENILDTNLTIGTYRYALNSNHFSNGIYLIKFNINDQVITRKIVKVQ